VDKEILRHQVFECLHEDIFGMYLAVIPKGHQLLRFVRKTRRN